jgi:transposase
MKDVRTDFNHKVSTAIAKHYGTVVVEALSIHGMQGNHHLAKSIADRDGINSG